MDEGRGRRAELGRGGDGSQLKLRELNEWAVSCRSSETR